MSPRSLLVAALLFSHPGPAPGDERWGELVARLQELHADYPEAMEGSGGGPLVTEEESAQEVVEAARALGPQAAGLLPGYLELEDAIRNREPPIAFAHRIERLTEATLQKGRVRQAPTQVPSLARGARIYAADCAVCHGARGGADTPVAATLHPRPSRFLDSGVTNPLSVFRAYNMVTYGIGATAMPSFPSLSEEDRWAVSFYLLTLRQRPCEGAAPRVTLSALTTRTDMDLIATFSEKALRCLRHRPADAVGRAEQPE